MTVRDIGIILNGATGGICSFQHLANSLAPIRAEGGLRIGDETFMPKLLLVGRDGKRLSEIARSKPVSFLPVPPWLLQSGLCLPKPYRGIS